MKKNLWLLMVLMLGTATVAFSQTTEKKVILQGFWWDYYNALHGESWSNYLAELAPRLKSLGIDAVWIPPTYKNAGTNSVGYSPFDHYDLGDKFQKGDTRTRMGTKDEMLRMIAIFHANGIEVIQDIVLNHVTNAGAANGAGGLDPEPTYSMATAGGYKNFRYVCYETPVPFVGGENAAEYLNRQGRWSKNYTNFHPHAGWNVINGNWESSFWGPDFSYGIDASGTGNGFGPSTNATYNPQQTWNYSRTQARDWIMWFARQTDMDGFRWDAIKHFPPFVVQDLSYNLKYLNGEHSLGEGMINFGEYVGGKSEIDGWVNNVTFSNGGNDMLAGTFDFSIRQAFKDISNSLGNYNLALVPSAQQNERVTYYSNGDKYVHRTLPFVNNHDTFRPIVNSTGNYTGWDAANEIGGHIEPNDPRLSMMYALTFAVDGTPLLFFEDLFSIGSNGNRYSHDPKNAATLPINSDLENIIWCHQNLNFGDGAYLVRGHSGNTGDHLIIERSAKAIISVNDNWNTWQTDWVDSNFPAGTVLVDYSGANGTATRIVQNDQRVQISTPPCNGTALNGRRGYAIWAPQGATGGYLPTRNAITSQEWEMEDDLGDSNCNSLQQGGRIPANSTAYRNVGRVFAAANTSVNYELIPTDPTQDLTIELLDLNGNIYAAQNGFDTLNGSFMPTVTGWVDVRVKNTNANQAGQKCYVQMDYTAPQTVDVSQFPTAPNVATWVGTENNDWTDCRNWFKGQLPNQNLDAIISANSPFMPEITGGIKDCNSLTIENGATLTLLGGNLYLKGNLLNNGTITGGNTCGVIVFDNTDAPQEIDGNSTTLCKVRFVNPSGITLKTALNVTEFLELSAGSKLTIGDNNVTIGTNALVLAGNGYIVTNDDPNSGGSVIRTVGSASALFPVGNADNYTPTYLKSNGGEVTFSVRAFSGVYENGNGGGTFTDINNSVNKTWEILSNSSGIFDLEVQLWWRDTNEGSSFDRNTARVMFNKNGTWEGLTTSPVGGNNPYNVTGSNATAAGHYSVNDNIAVSTTSIVEPTPNFTVVPNPTDGKFELLSEDFDGTLTVQMFNALGESVFEQRGTLQNINSTIAQQANRLPKGVYFIKIQTDTAAATTLKLLKE